MSHAGVLQVLAAVPDPAHLSLDLVFEPVGYGSLYLALHSRVCLNNQLITNQLSAVLLKVEFLLNYIKYL